MSVNIFNVKSYKFVLFLRILITGGLPEGGLEEISGADKDFMEDYTPWLWLSGIWLIHFAADVGRR